jgi:hypothetical protein
MTIHEIYRLRAQHEADWKEGLITEKQFTLHCMNLWLYAQAHGIVLTDWRPR